MKRIILLLLVLLIKFNLYSDTTILFYLNNKPIEITKWIKDNIKRENEKIKKINNINKKTPFQISKKLIKNEYKQFLKPKLSGFLALYGGYIDYSNIDGQISFPLRHSQPKVYLIITPNIKLIKAKGNTISHQELDETEKENTQIYLFKKKEDKNKKYYWKVIQEKIPENKIVNPLSIILLTNSKNLYVSTGDFISNKNNKQLVLPNNIYVINNDQNSKILLNFMKIKNYFEPVDTKNKKISDIVFQKLIINN